MTPEELTALKKKVDQEAEELASVAKVPISIYQPEHGKYMGAGRCHVCGQWSNHLLEAHDMLSANGVSMRVRERYVGKECCGGRYAQ